MIYILGMMGMRRNKQSQNPSCRNVGGHGRRQRAKENSEPSVSSTKKRNAENIHQPAGKSCPVQLCLPFPPDDGLCAAGNRWNDNRNNVGSNGNYWSSTQNPNNSNNAYNLNFNSGNTNWNNNNRNNGQSVRPVTEFPEDKTKNADSPIIPFKLTKEQLLVDLIRAYYDARRNKRRKYGQMRFEMNMETQLVSLRDEIFELRYAPSPSSCFIIHDPKMREIFAADFRDRVVHHLLCIYIYQLFDRSFIADCYSCRKGKGTSYGIDRLSRHIRRCSRNYKKKCYVLKMDIKGYFMNIRREKLLDIVCQTLDAYKNKKSTTKGKRWEEILDYPLIQYLCKVIILNDPIQNCIRQGNTEDWKELTPSKSLFCSKKGSGLPIGNLTSQLFSNVYLNGLDQMMKRQCKCRHYGRYVDDFYVVSRSREELKRIKATATQFLYNERTLTVHPAKTVIRSVVYGVDFLGAFIKPHRVYIRNSTLRRMTSKINALKQNLSEHTPQQIRDSLNSFLGLMKHYKTYNIRKHLFDDHFIWDEYGIFQINYSLFYPYNTTFPEAPHTLMVIS